jgi:hypothetical protein
MKRSVFGFIATVLVIMIVFAPRPWRSDAVADPGGGANLRVGQVLAPTFDATDLKDQDLGKLIRDPGPTLLLACIVGVVAAMFRRLLFTAAPSVLCGISIPAADWRGSRAPPLILL